MPATAAQKLALDCEADIEFFGGSAGSLKSHTLLLDAMQECDHPRLRGLICRESFPNLTDLVDKSFRLYQPKGGTYNEQKKTWTFPSGGQIRFGYMSADRDVFNFWGAEFSFIGFDESTFHSEFQVRTILSRLRSTDPHLKLRMRLASNPGNTGAAWHQQVFLRGACPIHDPDKCAVPGKLYRDARWPSDGMPIPFSVAFIPGRLTDHTLLQSNYADTLRSMSGAIAEQLLAGCWCELQGAYYTCLNRGMIQPLGACRNTWWDAHFLAIDYGFGKSSAAAGLYYKGTDEEKGKIRKIAEIVEPHVPAYEFARMIVNQMVKPQVDGFRRKIQIAFLDPANFKDIGDGHTIADQIQEVLEPYDIQVVPASNDRIGGWQLLYRMLANREFEITSACPKTFEALRTRMHDEKRPGDVKKAPGDPLDDVADETRYALYSFITSNYKPREAVIKEKLAGLDPTSAMAWYPNIAAETADPEPVGIGRRSQFTRRRVL